MSKYSNQKRICNCQTSSNKEIFQSDINHSFCEKCGCIIIKHIHGNIFYTLKSNKKQKEMEINPIMIIKSMKKITEENYPYIYNIYNNPDILYNFKNDKKLHMYLKKRKMILIKLQNLMKTFDYCDMIFYQCLFFLDTYLFQDIDEDMQENTILYYLVGYFLCSLKLKETDIIEPPLDSFFNLSKGVYLSPNKIAFYERLCLKRINYNIFSYSPYDWIIQLISNGIVFNNEVDASNEIILVKGHKHTLVNALNKYAIKLLLNLTSKKCFFKYAPMYIAFSIIILSREKYLDNRMIKPKLFHKLMDLYGVDYTKINKCYEELKLEMDLDNKKNAKDNNKNIEENNKEEKDEKNFKSPSIDKVKKSFSTFLRNKNLFVPNNIFRTNAGKSPNEDIIQNLNEKNVYTNSINVNHESISRNRFKLKTNHFSIDSARSLKNSLPIINSRYQNEKKELNTISTKSNYYFSNEKEKQNNINIEPFNVNEDEQVKNNIRTKKEKLLTSANKLPKINIDGVINNKVNNLNQFELNKESIPIGRTKKFKLKSTRNLAVNGFI